MARLLNIQLIKSTRERGDGKTDPYRKVSQWYTPAGELLLEDDYLNPDKRDSKKLIAYLEQMEKEKPNV